MAGVGFPVAVQRNSARWPCWMFSTEGVTVATGWAPSPAAEGDTSVKQSSKRDFQEAGGEIKRDNADWRYVKPREESKTHRVGVVLSRGNAFDHNESIRLREEERERMMGLSRHRDPHPWQSRPSEQAKEMKCGRQTSAWPPGILLSVPVWPTARSIPHDSRVTEQEKGLFQQGGRRARLSEQAGSPWDWCSPGPAWTR